MGFDFLSSLKNRSARRAVVPSGYQFSDLLSANSTPMSESEARENESRVERQTE
jgi:hypothetical protein